jgi:hypothetical protein
MAFAFSLPDQFIFCWPEKFRKSRSWSHAAASQADWSATS